MELDWHDARARFDAGRIGGAELASVYVADRVRRAAGNRWLQGPKRPALDPGPDAPAILRVLAERELHRLPRPVAAALVAWWRGLRDVALVFAMPSARDVLRMQARGARCVSLLDDAAAPYEPGAAYGGGGLGFAVHDLCHLEKLADPAHRVGQVGFFAALDRALDDPAWAAIEAGFDAAYHDGRDHVLADMNGSPVFLLVVLKSKVKLAVRRRLAAQRGAPCRAGELDAEEARAFAETVDVLLDALALGADARAAARAIASRHDAADAVRAAATIEAAFEATGREALARAAPARAG